MHIDGLQLIHLRLVDALARDGNLSKAAKQVGLSQPAASHALGRLRVALQDPIFIRTSAGMRPTPYGSKVAAAARDALRALRGGLERQLDFKASDSKRVFTVLMSDVGQILYLPRLLGRLASEAPGVTLRVRSLPATAPHLMLESGEVDLAIGTFTTLIAGCIQKRLFREHYVCIVRKDHPAFEHGMTTEAFRSVPHALAEASGYVHELLDRWLSRQKIPRVVKLYVPHFLALPLVVSRSDMLAIMASRMASTFAETVPLKILPPPTKLPTYDIKLFWHERFHREPANKWLRGVFVDLFGD